jgi:hypothetical protein
MRAAAGVTLFSGFCAELFGAAADATMPVVAARAKNTFKHFIAVSIVSAHPVSAACAEVYSLVTTTVHFAKIVRPSRCRGNATLALARAKRLFALHCPDKSGPAARRATLTESARMAPNVMTFRPPQVTKVPEGLAYASG